MLAEDQNKKGLVKSGSFTVNEANNTLVFGSGSKIQLASGKSINSDSFSVSLFVKFNHENLDKVTAIKFSNGDYYTFNKENTTSNVVDSISTYLSSTLLRKNQLDSPFSLD